MQEITRADKRKARAERFTREAEKSLTEKSARIASIQRDTALAWLDRYYAEAQLAIVTEQGDQARLEIDAAMSSGTISFPIKDAEAPKLPYLQAVIREGLHILPPASGPKFGEDARPAVPAASNPAGTGPVDEFDPSIFNRAVQAKPATGPQK